MLDRVVLSLGGFVKQDSRERQGENWVKTEKQQQSEAKAGRRDLHSGTSSIHNGQKNKHFWQNRYCTVHR